MTYDYTNWQPLTVDEVASLLAGLRVPWWIAGGQAIDLFVGRQTRSHGDTDVLIRRQDQLAVQTHLWAWDLHRATYPGLAHWEKGAFLTGRFRDIWCRPNARAPWMLQLMLLDTDGDQWVFKRDRTIRGPLSDLGSYSASGICYLRPEIQLLYKAKAKTMEKDQADFEVVLPLMPKASCAWLLDGLTKRFPEGHDWIQSLKRRMAQHDAALDGNSEARHRSQ